VKSDLGALRQAEQEVVELDRVRVELRSLGRSTLGLGTDRQVRNVLAALRAAGAPALVLGLLAGASAFPAYAVVFHLAELRDTLAVGQGRMGVVILAAPLVTALASFVVASRFGRSRSRASVVAGAVLVVGLVLAGFATSIKVLLLALLVCGLAAAAAPALHVARVADDRPTGDRVAGFTLYRAAEAAGPVVAMLVVALLEGAEDLTWRATFVVLALLALATAGLAGRAAIATPGRWDTDQVVEAIVAATGGEVADEPIEPLGAFESARRVTGIATARRVLTVNAILGLLSLPVTTYLLLLLEERFGLSVGQRAAAYAGCGLLGIGCVLYVLPRAEARWQQRPSALLSAAAVAAGVGLLALLLVGVLSVLPLVLLGLVVANACLLSVRPALDVVLMTVTPPALRPVAGALAGSCFWAPAALGGLFLLAGMDKSFGPGGALVAAAITGAQLIPLLRVLGRGLDADLDRMVDQVVESTELRQAFARGAHLPMLACRGIDFSYGQLQVLFGVDFTVDDGEMVALLGTNGAGKSTLLRVISGLGLPSRGSVRLRGVDVSYVDTERRMRMGISQIPGGKGVYPPMTVLENLRVIGYSCGRDKKSIERGIEETFATFPRLDERKRQLASTLSGGEQQMLSLARALIVRPQLLLIDELSLGLAPKIVGELLESVRRINAAGTAVVLVEQSVNVALSLVDHAYFMEKGEVRFDGPAKQLLDRPDLLRSVFLEGAAGQGRAS
jgi:ABC-type branched-subunit amino acid transport system ATPase component